MTERNTFNTLFCHVLSIISLAAVPPAWSGGLSLTLYIFNDSAWVFSRLQKGCPLSSYLAINYTFSYCNNSKDNRTKNTYTWSNSSRYPSLMAPHGAASPWHFVMDSCKPGCVGRQMQSRPCWQSKWAPCWGPSSRGTGSRHSAATQRRPQVLILKMGDVS